MTTMNAVNNQQVYDDNDNVQQFEQNQIYRYFARLNLMYHSLFSSLVTFNENISEITKFVEYISTFDLVYCELSFGHSQVATGIIVHYDDSYQSLIQICYSDLFEPDSNLFSMNQQNLWYTVSFGPTDPMSSDYTNETELSHCHSMHDIVDTVEKYRLGYIKKQELVKERQKSIVALLLLANTKQEYSLCDVYEGTKITDKYMRSLIGSLHEANFVSNVYKYINIIYGPTSQQIGVEFHSFGNRIYTILPTTCDDSNSQYYQVNLVTNKPTKEQDQFERKQQYDLAGIFTHNELIDVLITQKKQYREYINNQKKQNNQKNKITKKNKIIKKQNNKKTK